MATPIRVGAVSYLNAKPLYYRLCEYRARRPAVRWTCRAGWPSSLPTGSSTSR